MLKLLSRPLRSDTYETTVQIRQYTKNLQRFNLYHAPKLSSYLENQVAQYSLRILLRKRKTGHACFPTQAAKINRDMRMHASHNVCIQQPIPPKKYKRNCTSRLDRPTHSLTPRNGKCVHGSQQVIRPENQCDAAIPNSLPTLRVD